MGISHYDGIFDYKSDSTIHPVSFVLARTLAVYRCYTKVWALLRQASGSEGGARIWPEDYSTGHVHLRARLGNLQRRRLGFSFQVAVQPHSPRQSARSALDAGAPSPDSEYQRQLFRAARRISRGAGNTRTAFYQLMEPEENGPSTNRTNKYGGVPGRHSKHHTGDGWHPD